jgi:uncharacterized pyridoxal phosphate-containing UPF0001 family protein
LHKIDQAAAEADRHVEALVQVDLAREPTKHGVLPARVHEIFEASTGLQATRIVGLMVLPPAVEDPEEARPYFAMLRTLRDRLAAQGVSGPALTELSMGMSHDFEIAVEEGATLVRVGTAIFGSRTHV